MTHEYDAIIVGGRVAGASTGMLLARRGHRVLIVERAPMPSDTVSTHAVMRTGVLQLTRWGLLDRIIAAGTPHIRNITLGFGDQRVPFDLRPDFGVEALFAPRRQILDQILLETARESGAEVRDRTTMTGLLHGERGRVEGIRVGRGSNAETITARYVIGADGHRSRVADLAGSTIRESHRATNTVHYGYYENIDTTGFWFQFTPGVNAGLIPTNEGQCLVFVGRPAHRRARFSSDPEGEFHHLLRNADDDLAEVVRQGSRVGRFRGTSGLAGFIRQAWGPGWALVGDAGYTKDPISAHGISDALRDAELCARAIEQALAEPGHESQTLAWYERLRDSMSRRMYEQSKALARFEWSAEEASARMRVVSDEIRAECETMLSLPDWSARPILATR